MSGLKVLGTAALIALGGTAASADTAIFAGGCFWCVEADFEKVQGVGDVVSGFTGGTTADPVYRASGDHIESARIPFDESQVEYRQLVHLFLRSIDVFDDGGQFCDRGLEYTSAIFAMDEEQAQIAREEIARAEQELGREIVTPVRMASEFYPVDDYHQDYYKSEERLAVSSVGLAVPKSVAYERYRQGCGRDQRVRAIWGDDAAPFVKGASS